MEAVTRGWKMTWIAGYHQTFQCQKRLVDTTDAKRIRPDFLLLVVLMALTSTHTKGSEPYALLTIHDWVMCSRESWWPFFCDQRINIMVIVCLWIHQQAFQGDFSTFQYLIPSMKEQVDTSVNTAISSIIWNILKRSQNLCILYHLQRFWMDPTT